jgi:predicted Zn-ribbon and HTH transcriptional regulator
MTPRELAKELGMRVSDLLSDLEHLRKSLKERFEVEPARCEACGFTFSKRTRLSKPSRCPECRSERIDGPLIRVRPD